MGWLPAGDSHEISLVDGKVVARSTGSRATGRPLKTLPKALREHSEVERLRRLAEWLDRHDATCLAQVNAWLVSSLPVQTGLLAKVWPDPSWQDILRDLVVVGADPEEPGFLREVTGSGELRLVNLDGETIRISPETVTLPHPVLLTDLDDLREFATELGITQRVEQLHRRVLAKPAEIKEKATTVSDFNNTRVARGVTARAASLGYQSTRDRVTCRIWEAGCLVEATMWFDDDYWSSEATLGHLRWNPMNAQQPMRLVDVGPVAWSEGMRMATALGGSPVGTGKDA
ncbi:DUF4132 domain-containing protein [Micromonospora sp. NPDC003197]